MPVAPLSRTARAIGAIGAAAGAGCTLGADTDPRGLISAVGAGGRQSGCGGRQSGSSGGGGPAGTTGRTGLRADMAAGGRAVSQSGGCGVAPAASSAGSGIVGLLGERPGSGLADALSGDGAMEL